MIFRREGGAAEASGGGKAPSRLPSPGSGRKQSHGERLAPSSADLQPGRASLRQAGADGGLHHLLLAALRVRVRAALAGAAIPTQALQLPDGVSVLVSAVGGSASAALLLLFQRLRDRKHTRTLGFLAALLFPSLPAVLHPQPHESVLRTGESDTFAQRQETTCHMYVYESRMQTKKYFGH